MVAMGNSDNWAHGLTLKFLGATKNIIKIVKNNQRTTFCFFPLLQKKKRVLKSRIKPTDTEN